MIFALTAFGFVAHIFQTKALQIEKAGRVAPVLILQILFNWILDFAVIGTTPMANELIGGLLIIGSNLGISILRCFNCIS